MAFTALGAAAKSVLAKSGNIYLTDEAGTAKQVTFSGRDSGPVLSPDGLWIVFIRAVSGQRISTASGDELEPTEPAVLVRRAVCLLHDPCLDNVACCPCRGYHEREGALCLPRREPGGFTFR
jgi:hypothetical protein